MHIRKKFRTFAQNYTVTMNNHLSKAQIKWVRSLQLKKHRDEQGLFVAEGAKCVQDLQASFTLKLLVSTDNATDTEIAQMSSLRTPQGIIGVFQKPILPALDLTQEKLIVALDGVQDPGNLGTIIRTCDWFGIYDIICSTTTADCYNPKVVQATMGALARVRVRYVDDIAQTIQALKQANYPIYGTLLEGKDMYDEGSIMDKTKGVIVMGNEGNGISENVRQVVTHPIRIPSHAEAREERSESLNVSIATAIVLAEFRRTDNTLTIK